ncbi:MAG: IclR family transcriptional regulator C-terminal domain-containing protein [Pseudomonadota bacterium]
MGNRAHSKGLDQGASDAAGPAAEDADFVAAFARGLKVIRAFGENSQMLTLTQVAERAELTAAGARRLLLTLVALGYAGTKGRLYFLTPKVLSLGYAYLTSLPLYHFAQPILDDLVAETGETCAVSVLDDTETVYALRIPVRRVLGGDSGIGTRRPAHATSMGRVLLAGLSERAFADYLKRANLQAFTSKTVTDPDRLRERIAEVRARGYAWVMGELDEHVCGLSVPIKDEDGAVIAALNVSFNQPRMTRNAVMARLLPRLKAAAEQIERSVAVRGRSMADRPV